MQKMTLRVARRCTYAELCSLTGLCRNAVKRAVRSLQASGRLALSQANKFSPIRFTLRNPAEEQRRAAVEALQRRILRAPHKGEALMREYLSLLVDSDEY